MKTSQWDAFFLRCRDLQVMREPYVHQILHVKTLPIKDSKCYNDTLTFHKLKLFMPQALYLFYLEISPGSSCFVSLFRNIHIIAFSIKSYQVILRTDLITFHHFSHFFLHGHFLKAFTHFSIYKKKSIILPIDEILKITVKSGISFHYQFAMTLNVHLIFTANKGSKYIK